MTDKLNCPFCGEKLQTHTMTPGRILICVNKGCPVDSVVMKRIVWQALIDGKKAQEDLECMKHNYSVVSEQKEIAYQNYLKITGDLQTQLQKAQDALKEIARHDINEQRGEPKSYVIGYQEIKELAIAAITEQEE